MFKVRQIIAMSEPVRHLEESKTDDDVTLSVSERPWIVVGYRKPRKEYWILGKRQGADRPIRKKGYEYRIAVDYGEAGQKLPAAFARLESVAQKYDLRLKPEFQAVPADMRVLIHPWKIRASAQGTAGATAVVTLVGVIPSPEVRKAFEQYALRIAEPYQVATGYHTVNLMTGRAEVTQLPYLHFFQKWPKLSEPLIINFWANILETARTHRISLGAWDVPLHELTRRRMALPPYLTLRGTIAARRHNSVPKFFRLSYFHI